MAGFNAIQWRVVIVAYFLGHPVYDQIVIKNLKREEKNIRLYFYSKFHLKDDLRMELEA